MDENKTNIATRHPVLVYYLLALVFSWSIYLLLGAVKQGWIDLEIPYSIHYLAAFGPLLAAVIVTAIISGSEGLRELWSRMTRWRVGWRWALFCILSPAAVFFLSIPIVRLIKGEWPDLRLLGQANYLPYLGIGVIVIWIVTYGFGEETGWRGFALPRLQKRMSVARATLLLGIMWAFWHLPAFLYLETLQEMGLIFLPGFIFGVLCGAVIFTWIYNGTAGSILMVALWHGIFDFFSASKAGQDIIPIVMSALVIIWALVITNLHRRWNFYNVEKQVM